MSYGKRAVNAALGDPVKRNMPYKSAFSNKTITKGKWQTQVALEKAAILGGALALKAYSDYRNK